MPFAFHAQCRVQHDRTLQIRFSRPDDRHPDQSPYLADLNEAQHAQLDALIAAANEDPWSVAEEAVRTMAEKGRVHLDMHWCHVAFTVHIDPDTKSLQRRAVLIDLTRVKVKKFKMKPSKEEQIDEAVESMLQELKDSESYM